MSRKDISQLEFGSDSFLDIVANIVGILIILIVIAGLRVSRTPVLMTKASTIQTCETSAQTAADSNTHQALVGAPTSKKPASQPTDEPPIESTQQALKLENELASLDQSLAVNDAALRKATVRESAVQQEIAAASMTLADEVEALSNTSASISQLQIQLERAKKMLRSLQTQLTAAKRERRPAKNIKHQLTPVSQVVKGREFHFRLAQNRVARVPIDELTAKLRAQILKQKSWLLKFRQHQGRIGPVGGFTMTYVVERTALSVLDELRLGRGYVQIVVSEWQIEPQTDLETQSAKQALLPDSEFTLALLTADSDTTLTFWVYPDSFELYRRLQKAAQRQGFTVAARPLPFGIPITGSPRGSRSIGQ